MLCGRWSSGPITSGSCDVGAALAPRSWILSPEIYDARENLGGRNSPPIHAEWEELFDIGKTLDGAMRTVDAESCRRGL